MSASCPDCTERKAELETALRTLLYHANIYAATSSVKTRQRLGMATTYARSVLEGNADPMVEVRHMWSDDHGLVTHFEVLDGEKAST